MIHILYVLVYPWQARHDKYKLKIDVLEGIKHVARTQTVAPPVRVVNQTARQIKRIGCSADKRGAGRSDVQSGNEGTIWRLVSFPGSAVRVERSNQRPAEFNRSRCRMAMSEQTTGVCEWEH